MTEQPWENAEFLIHRRKCGALVAGTDQRIVDGSWSESHMGWGIGYAKPSCRFEISESFKKDTTAT